MTVDEIHNLMDKYNIELDGDLCLTYLNYSIGHISPNMRTDNEHEKVGILFNDFNCRVLNPIAAECKIKHLVEDIKKDIAKRKIERIQEDFE